MATGVEENWPVPMRAIGAQNLLTMPGGVTQSGYLHKKGGSQWKIMKWPLRFVIIHKGCIYYFKSSTAAYPQGAFSLNGYNRDNPGNYRPVSLISVMGKLFEKILKDMKKVMRSTEETTSSNVFPFKIIHVNKKHRTWYFSASCEEERKKWMIGLRKEIDRYHEKVDSQGNLSDYSDTEKFYGSIERPVLIKYTSRESESGDYADDDDDDDDEDDYLRPDGLHVSPESEDFRPIQPGRSIKKPLPPLPSPHHRRMSHGLVVIKEELPNSLQDHLSSPFPAKTENSALPRHPSPSASPGCPKPPPVHLKPTFCEKQQPRRLSETIDPDMKVERNFPMELNMHLQHMTGKRSSFDVAPSSLPIHKGSSAGPPPVPMTKGPNVGPPPESVKKGYSAGPPLPMNKGSIAGTPLVPVTKETSAGSGLVNRGSGAGSPAVPLSKGSTAEFPPMPMPKVSSAGDKLTLLSISSETVHVKPKLYKPELLPKGPSALAKPPPVAVKPKFQKHNTLPRTPLHRSSPEGQSFRSVETEKPFVRQRSQSQPTQRHESEDDDDDYENVQLPSSVFVNTTESNDVERLFMSTSPGSNPENGLYCIRNSSKSGKVLVVWDDSEKKVRNYRIFEKESKFYLESEIKFTCLASMVEFYHKHTLPIHDHLHLRVPYGYKNPL